MKFFAVLFAVVSLANNVAFAADDKECEGALLVIRYR